MTDIVDGGMSDNSGLSDIGLRDRIAAAIYTDNGFGWSLYMCEEAADAVIAELENSLIGYQIWNSAEWISVNSGWVPYEIHRNADGTGGGWRVTVQRIEADDETD